MADLNSSPVALGAGSYDYDKLQAGLDAAAAAPAETYAETVSSTLDSLDETGIAKLDSRAIGSYHFVDRTHELADGVKVTETIQVFADGAAAQKAELEAAKADGGKSGTDKETKGSGK